MEAIRPLKAILQVTAGASIGEVCIEAAAYSLKNMINVEYEFNGKIYKITYNDFYGLSKELKDTE